MAGLAVLGLSGPGSAGLVCRGMDLGPWLVARDVTVVSTLPTLAALWPPEALDAIRLLVFGGEAWPPELAERLAVDGREVWNTDGQLCRPSPGWQALPPP